MSETIFSTRKTAALTGMSAKTVAAILAALSDNPTLEQIVAAFVSAARAEGAPANVLNVSQLNRITGLDRATINKRLAEASVAPAPGSKKKEKLFDIEASLAALVAAEGDKLSESKGKKLSAEASLKQLELERERGELMPTREVREHAFNFVKAMHTRISKRYPRENAKRLRRCKSDVDLQRTIETDLSLIFDDLKRDYPEIF